MRQDPAEPRGAAGGQVSRDDDGHDDTHDDYDVQGPEGSDCPAPRRQESPARQVHQVQRVKMIMMDDKSDRQDDHKAGDARGREG